MGVWQLRALGEAGRHGWLVFYLISEGVLSPLIMPAMLPDMLDSATSGRAPADEHTTNIVTSIFTTGFNTGGIVGPLAGAVLVPQLASWRRPGEDPQAVGFRMLLTLFALAFLALGLLISGTELANRYGVVGTGYKQVGLAAPKPFEERSGGEQGQDSEQLGAAIGAAEEQEPLGASAEAQE